MSITPYINYTVSDLSNVIQPYVNSTTEFGYFGNLGRQTGWNSMPSYLLTNNGVAAVDASGLRILNAGIYKLSMCIDISSGSLTTGDQQMFFNFGTTRLTNVVAGSITGSLCGPRTDLNEMFAYNNSPFPKIISWITQAFTSGTNPTLNENWANSAVANQMVYIYNYNSLGTGAIKSGLLSTELTFVTNQPTTIYFNAIAGSGAGNLLSMGDSYFTLQLMTLMRNYITRPIPSLNWTGVNFPVQTSQNLMSIASSGNGRFLYVPYYYGATRICKLKRYDTSGNAFIDATNTLPELSGNAGFWGSVAASNDGSIVYVGSSGVTGTGTVAGIYRSVNGNAATMTFSSLIGVSTTGGIQIHSIATTADGSIMQAVSGTVGGSGVLYIYGQIGGTSVTNTTPGRVYRGITLTSDGLNGYATSSFSETQIPGPDISGNIYKLSPNFDNTNMIVTPIFTNSSPDPFRTTRWAPIKTSSDGRIVLAGSTASASEKNQGLWRSTDFGNTWFELNVGRTDTTRPDWYSIALSSDGQRVIAAEYNGNVYVSQNSGDSWSISSSLAKGTWTGVSSSSDGIKSGIVRQTYAFYTGTYS